MENKNNNDSLTIENLLKNEDLRKIIKEFEDALAAGEAANFNIFKIISDYYYRENFHGDIIEAFLSPEGKHGEGCTFLEKFIEMIELPENIREVYKEAQLSREMHISGNRRIDFVIKNKEDNQCIIIENKLHDAIDQDNQLPAYVNALEENGKKVDAVIYIPLSVDKTPNETTWKNDVSGLVKRIPAEQLLEKWVKPCINAAKKSNSKEILSQYAKLLISLQAEKLRYQSIIKLRDFLCNYNVNVKKTIEMFFHLQEDPCNSWIKRIQESEIGLQLADELIYELSKSLYIHKHPNYKSCCVIKLKNNREIYIFCAANKGLNYRMRIINGCVLENQEKWISQNDRFQLKEKEDADNYINFGLNQYFVKI